MGINELFYSRLPVLNIGLSQAFKPGYFHPVPAGWHIVVADIKNSTAAVAQGRANDVNMVAAAVIILALNIARRRKIDLPFLFGGDGATLLVPESLLPEILAALQVHVDNCRRNFAFEMHVGHLSMAAIQSAGHFLQVARLHVGKGFDKAMMVGGALRYAESVIKQQPEPLQGTPAGRQCDLTGLECRWNRVKPPQKENEVVCYLVEAVHPAEQVTVYAAVMQQLDAIYGPPEQRNPIAAGQMQLLNTYSKLKKEMLVKFGGRRAWYVVMEMIKTQLGHLSISHHIHLGIFSGSRYVNQLVENADTITIDGRITTVITGSAHKRLAFVAYLQQLEHSGKLVFGYHVNRESNMTCYIEDRRYRHIHFVDGADGGYTEASKHFKSKWTARQWAPKE